MVDLIERGAPAIMLCHWPGMYTHGTKKGFRDFQGVVTALAGRFRDETLWMKVSEIARYWAAKELTAIERVKEGLTLKAPFACPAFTLRVDSKRARPPQVTVAAKTQILKEVKHARDLAPGKWKREEGALVICFDLEKGNSLIKV
jgi:hypothetical protein